MDNQSLITFVMNNLTYIVAGMGILIIAMYGILIHLWMSLSSMKRSYKKMMEGSEGTNLEHVLMKCLDETKLVTGENKVLKEENMRMDALLQTALTRVGVVRFSAFEDMGSDLSYAVAMLDSHNNGVVFSSIFARDESRSYAKPILDGTSTYTLTGEEEEALRKAMKKM